MNYIKDIFAIDFQALFLGIFALLGFIIFLIETFEKVTRLFGIEFSWIRKKNEQTTLLSQHSKIIRDLENEQKEAAQHQIKISNSIDEISESLFVINEKLNNIEEQNKNQINATIDLMANNLNEKCQYYITQLKGVPADEIDDFIMFFNNYEKIGGNHGIKAKVDYCINHLPIIPNVSK